jgi:hypothetical protein
LGQDIFEKLGMSPNQPMASHTPMTSTAYTVPLDHFTGMTNNVVIVSDQFWLVLTQFFLFISLTLPWSHKLPMFLPESAVITQPPIGTPLPLRSNTSLPPGYNTLNTSVIT